MGVPLLATKLHLPRAHRNLIARPRLIERLDDGLKYPLTLISAPAGSGKTSALNAWISHHERCIAWLSLDEGDNDPTRFWIYVIAALQQLRPDVGNHAHVLLQAQGQQPQPIESVLTVLVNEIAAFPDVPSTDSTSPWPRGHPSSGGPQDRLRSRQALLSSSTTIMSLTRQRFI